jgi:hypothetical protein
MYASRWCHDSRKVWDSKLAGQCSVLKIKFGGVQYSAPFSVYSCPLGLCIGGGRLLGPGSRRLACGVFCACTAAGTQQTVAAGLINVYTYLDQELIGPLVAFPSQV